MNRYTFVIRIFQENGKVWGQLSESNRGWQNPFHSLQELWKLLDQRVSTCAPEGTAPAPDQAAGKKPEEFKDRSAAHAMED